MCPHCGRPLANRQYVSAHSNWTELDDFRIATTRRIGDVKSSSYYDEMNNFHCYFQQSTLRKIPFGETCRPGWLHFKFKFRQFVRIGFVNGQFEAVERNEPRSRVSGGHKVCQMTAIRASLPLPAGIILPSLAPFTCSIQRAWQIKLPSFSATATWQKVFIQADCRRIID